MLDFFQISRRRVKKNVVEIYPTFIIMSKSNDLMVKGRDFYAVWDEEAKMWSQDEQSVINQVDKEVEKEYLKAMELSKADPDLALNHYIPKYMWDSDSGVIDKWHKYVQKQCRDHYHNLNEKVIFANSGYHKRDYSSIRLDYAIEDGPHEAYDELMGTLYSREELDKLEWAVGSIIAGDSKRIQKCIFLYGSPGTGKGTFLDLVGWLFGGRDGYCCYFRAKELGDSNSAFALESFKDNPLVGIDADAKLSRLDDNTKFNSVISHEVMEVNEKFKSKYTMRFNTFLFIGANEMVKITSARSGLTRRIIDVIPTGNLVEERRYFELCEKIQNEELGAIAKHCLDRYNELGRTYYSKYYPTRMAAGTNHLYEFLAENYLEFKQYESLSLGYLWEEYQKYCDETNYQYKMNRQTLKTELMDYFEEYKDDCRVDGEHKRSVYFGLKSSKFLKDDPKNKLMAIPNKKKSSWLDLKDASEFSSNVLDVAFAECFAQYAVGEGGQKPSMAWANVTTKLKDLDTSKTHYVRPPDETYITIDFDKKDENGNKSLALNLDAASDWPETYAEVSKGGEGLHLEYRYLGDVGKVSNLYEEDVEIKIFPNSNKSSLRRRLSKCNDIQIATLEEGFLPTKKEKQVINTNAIDTDKKLRKFVIKCLGKKHWGHTAPEIDFLYSELEKCYQSGLHYDISDLRDDIVSFASMSTNQSQKCLSLVSKMHFRSDEPSDPYPYVGNGDRDDKESPITFFDVEVFPNLFVLCYKVAGEEPIGMINPSGDDIYKLCKYRLVGFNNRKYDNHILYARMHGYNNLQLYNLSQSIINDDKSAFFGEAYNLSYTDIYDFASASDKMSLKKWEIKLGIHHQELGLPWDQEVPEELWSKVVEYCLNDVVATEAVFNNKDIHSDFIAREILADLADMTVNDTTNSLTAKIIFENDKNPQKEFVYTDLSTIFPGYEYDASTPHTIPSSDGDPDKSPVVYYGIERSRYTERALDKGTKVLSDDGTMRMVKIVNGKSIYRGCDPSEGGRVFAEPGVYENVALLDISSMHPSSIEALNLFGDRYTKRFSDLKLARLYIKHKEFDKAKELFGGKLSKYLDDPETAKSLSTALKTAINSVYGLTSASFKNKFRDPRNVDNIVAKRGALFMIDLQYAVREQGYVVVHVKTDSIKIADADDKIINFVMEFGKKYGYDFEHEATYERLCLVNESTYIAKDKSDGHWTATGTQFQIPYVFKRLFSHEPITFEDLCETKSVTSALYLDFNEKLGPDEHDYQFVGKVGLFCPVVPGVGGGILLREKDGKYNAATGTKGYRWMEAEMVKNLHLEDAIDMSFHEKRVDEAIDTIRKFGGDFEMFVSDEPVPDLPF